MRNTIDGPLGLTTHTVYMRVYENDPVLPITLASQKFHPQMQLQNCSATYILPDDLDITNMEVSLSDLYEMTRHGEARIDNPPVMIWNMKHFLGRDPYIRIQIVGGGTIIPFHLISGSDEGENLLEILRMQLSSALRDIYTNSGNQINRIQVLMDNFAGQRIGLEHILSSIAPEFAHLELIQKETMSEKFSLALDNSEP